MLPLSATTVSALLVPLQAASWLMSILAILGAMPSSFTCPLTVPTVLGSLGVAAGAAGAAFSSVAFDDCSVFSFLLQPANSRKLRQSRPISANHIFLFMISPFPGIVKIASAFAARGRKLNTAI